MTTPSNGLARVRQRIPLGRFMHSAIGIVPAKQPAPTGTGGVATFGDNDAAVLSGMQFPGRKSTRESNETPAGIQEAIADLKHEFAVECCRIAGVKALHA